MFSTSLRWDQVPVMFHMIRVAQISLTVCLSISISLCHSILRLALNTFTPHILTRPQEQFWSEWDQTSSHALRSSYDMQYAFAYFYFLIGQSRPFNVSDQFSRLDTDSDGDLLLLLRFCSSDLIFSVSQHSCFFFSCFFGFFVFALVPVILPCHLDFSHMKGLLNVNELRTLITRVYDIPTTMEHWHEFESILLNCSYLQPPLETLGVGVGHEGKEVSPYLFAYVYCGPYRYVS